MNANTELQNIMSLSHSKENKFDSHLDNVSSWLISEGVDKPLGDRKGIFSTLPEAEQIQALARAEKISNGVEILPPNATEYDKFLRFCRLAGLEPTDSAITPFLTNEHCWEVISFELENLYRSARIFELSSYTLEEFEAYSPLVLFKRPDVINQQLISITGQLMKKPNLLNLESMTPYIIEETLSEEKRQFEMQHVAACPMRKVGSTGGSIAFCSIMSVGEVETGNQNNIRVFN